MKYHFLITPLMVKQDYRYILLTGLSTIKKKIKTLANNLKIYIEPEGFFLWIIEIPCYKVGFSFCFYLTSGTKPNGR